MAKNFSLQKDYAGGYQWAMGNNTSLMVRTSYWIPYIHSRIKYLIC